MLEKFAQSRVNDLADLAAARVIQDSYFGTSRRQVVYGLSLMRISRHVSLKNQSSAGQGSPSIFLLLGILLLASVAISINRLRQ